VAGISIGSLNCAIIAGNAPDKRVQRLHEFWDAICLPPAMSPAASGAHQALFGQYMSPWGDMLESMGHTMFSSMAAMSALMVGQDGFFKPRPLAPGGGSPATTSFYDTAPIISTLERFADFDRINSGETRVSLGATNVASGNFVYFDSEQIKLTPKHFLASGSLPPGFPATEIDGEFYWDGGCVSNTPLEYVLGIKPRRDTLVFQVDLWSAAGQLPTDIFQVNERLKDIQFSSRTRTITNAVHMTQAMRAVLLDTIERIPQSVKAADPWFDNMVRHMMGARFNVIHLIYRNKQAEGHYKDYQFSAQAKQMHWQTGLHDMDETLRFPACLALPAEGENFVSFDVHTRKRTSSSQFAPNNVVKAPAPQKKAPVKKAAGKRAAKPAARATRTKGAGRA
jgi:NTE family protein